MRTTQQTVDDYADEIPLIQPFGKFIREAGLSRTTGWRYVQRGWIQVTRIANRPYITREAVQKFLGRAEAGEFAKLNPKPLEA